MLKTAIKILVFLGLGSLAPISGCQSTEKSAKNAIPLSSEKPMLKQLQLSGQNHHPIFTDDGQFLVYLSHDRPSHKKSQIYIYRLDNGNEKRITYQDGEIYDFTLEQNSKKIFYSSSTDEVKENLSAIAKIYANSTTTPGPIDGSESQYLIQVLGSTLPPTEIYMSSIDGYEITRLTHNPGFDGQLSRALNHRFYFAGYDHSLNRMQLKTFDLQKRKSTHFIDSEFDDEFPAASPDGKKIVWVRSPAKASQSEIWIADSSGQNVRALVQNSGLNLHPTWHPNGKEIIWSSTLSGGSEFNLFSIRDDGRCITQLTSRQGTLLHPEFNSDGTRLSVTIENPQQQQIGFMNYQSPPCPEPTTSISSDQKTPDHSK